MDDIKMILIIIALLLMPFACNQCKECGIEAAKGIKIINPF